MTKLLSTLNNNFALENDGNTLQGSSHTISFMATSNSLLYLGERAEESGSYWRRPLQLP